MIRVITFRNFPLVDLEIEQVYRRRRTDAGADYPADEDEELLALMREARCRRGRDWLRRLAREVDTLSVKSRKRGSIGRRHRRSAVASEATAPADAHHRSRKAG